MKKIKLALFMALSFSMGIFWTRRAATRIIYNKEKELKKNIYLFRLTNEWLAFRQKKGEVSEYFKDKQYHSIVIYGMGCLGERLVDELKGSDVSVQYAIDQYKKDSYEDVDIKNMDEELSEADVVVVTPIYDFWEIKRSLANQFTCPIISLEEIIYKFE